MRYIFCVLLIISFELAYAQAINNATSYRAINSEQYFRHTYDNDFYTKTDKYYTQGINMEVVAPSLAKLPTRFILLHPASNTTQYGLSIQHNAYTPTSITDTAIRYRDHPYAAAAMLQAFATSTDYSRKQRITSMISLGVIGKISGGQWMQETIHRNLDNAMPQGWKYQIANDAIINYRLFYEKRILNIDKILDVNATAQADAGTLETKGALGANIILGYFESSYNKSVKRKFSIYTYAHGQTYLIGYDAMLQGGVLNPESTHTISGRAVEHYVAEGRFGIVLKYRTLYLEYYQCYRSRRFITGNPHAWGGVLLGIGLN